MSLLSNIEETISSDATISELQNRLSDVINVLSGNSEHDIALRGGFRLIQTESTGLNDLEINPVIKTSGSLIKCGVNDSFAFEVKYNGDVVQTGNVSIYNGFVSGWAGAGYRLDYGISVASQSNLEIDNLTVRRSMSVYELLVRQVRATNGGLFISTSGKVKNTYDGYNIEFVDESGGILNPFAVGDLIMTQRMKKDGTVVKVIYAAITGITAGVCAVTYTGGGYFAVGDEVVKVGNTTTAARQNSIYMTSDDTNSPFIDMITGVNSWSAWGAATKTQLRIGNLSGITDADFGGALSGYGLYCTNAYIKGTITLSDGAAVVLAALNGGLTITGTGITLATNGSIKAGQTAYNTGTGFWIGSVTGTPKFSIGDGSTKYFIYDGTDITLKGGKFKWATSGVINFYDGADNIIVSIGDNIVSAYSGVRVKASNAAFYVTNAGESLYSWLAPNQLNLNAGVAGNVVLNAHATSGNLQVSKGIDIGNGYTYSINGVALPIDDWDDAYGWGNHASAGYLTSVSKSAVEAVLTGTITSHNHSGVYAPAANGAAWSAAPYQGAFYVSTGTTWTPVAVTYTTLTVGGATGHDVFSIS
jgi:hypothetical protein